MTEKETGGVRGLQFVKVEDYTTFVAEYAIEGHDLVFHFFLPPELIAQPGKLTSQYWKEIFPMVLEPIVFEIFKVQPPRVQAAYVSELDLNSWWLRAYGFADLLDPDALCSKFFERLDSALEANISTS